MTSTRSEMDVQSLLDRTAIRARLESYLSSVDRRDWSAYGDCFTQDARFEFGHDVPEVVIGRAAIVERAVSRKDRPVSNHLLSNASIEVSNDRATARTNCIAHLVVEGDGDSHIVVRGLEYDDELVAEAGRIWRISRRAHRPVWQFEVPSAPLGY